VGTSSTFSGCSTVPDGEGDGPAAAARNGGQVNQSDAGLSVESLSVTGTVIEVHGVGGFYEQYPIDSYAGILDAIATAQEDLPPRGGTIVIPNGVHEASTPLVIEKPLKIVPESNAGYVMGASSMKESASCTIEWSGGTETPITMRGTANSPKEGIVEQVTIGAILFVPEEDGEGNQVIEIDGTDTVNPDGSAARCIYLDGPGFAFWGGEDPLVHGYGTVFAIYAFGIGARWVTGDIFVVDRVPEQRKSGPPSEVYLYYPRLWSSKGYWAARLEANANAIYGGNIQQMMDYKYENRGGHGVSICRWGGIWGTKFEGIADDVGGIGVRYAQTTGDNTWNPGPMYIHPSVIGKYGTRCQIGGGKGGSNRARMDFAAKGAANHDVVVKPGGQHRDTRIQNDQLSVENERLAQDDLQEVVGVEYARSVVSWDVPVDSTGRKTTTLQPHGHAEGDTIRPPYDDVEFSVAGGGVTDFDLGQPHVASLDPTDGIEAAVDVNSASDTSGATTTIRATFRSYTV
jgi:hypothetical protein